MIGSQPRQGRKNHRFSSATKTPGASLGEGRVQRTRLHSQGFRARKSFWSATRGLTRLTHDCNTLLPTPPRRHLGFLFFPTDTMLKLSTRCSKSYDSSRQHASISRRKSGQSRRPSHPMLLILLLTGCHTRSLWLYPVWFLRSADALRSKKHGRDREGRGGGPGQSSQAINASGSRMAALPRAPCYSTRSGWHGNDLHQPRNEVGMEAGIISR